MSAETPNKRFGHYYRDEDDYCACHLIGQACDCGLQDVLDELSRLRRQHAAALALVQNASGYCIYGRLVIFADALLEALESEWTP